MATIKVIDLLDRASILLQDADHTRYPNAELLKFFNDAQNEVVLHRPDANSVNATLALANGSKQSLPSAALRLLDIVQNVDGRSVTQVSRKILDESLPDWHNAIAGTNGIEHFIYDPADPKNFYVYPKGVSGTHSLVIIYSATPPAISISNFSTDTQTISLDDVYANAALDYILYRAYQKDAEYSGNAARSQMHYQSFAQSLGIKTQADGATTPIPKNPDALSGRM
jgi:hypothetical protein